MAVSLEAKAATEVVERRWLVPVDDNDGASAVATSASGITVDSAALEGDEVVLVLSAGTAGTTASITVTVTTSQSRTLVETLYIPVIVTTAGVTVESIVEFALRKVFGNGEDPDADASADAVERLQDMLEHWRVTGADIGAPYPLTTATVLRCPHGDIMAVKNSLAVEVADLYGRPITPGLALNARRGLQAIKQRNVGEPEAVEYF